MHPKDFFAAPLAALGKHASLFGVWESGGEEK